MTENIRVSPGPRGEGNFELTEFEIAGLDSISIGILTSISVRVHVHVGVSVSDL